MARYWERQPDLGGTGKGETPKQYAAFQIYRDMGPQRSMQRVAEELSKSLPLIKRWAAWNKWGERVQAMEDYHEMLRRDAVEEYERARAVDLASRRDSLRRKNFENEERAASLMSGILDELEQTPFVEERTMREDQKGNAVEVHILPVLSSSFDLAAQRLHKIATRSEPQKVAPTDPTGEHEYGQSADEIDAEFEELLRNGGNPGDNAADEDL